MKLYEAMKILDIVDSDVAKHYKSKCSIREETWLYDSYEGLNDIMELDLVEAIMLLRNHLEAKQVQKDCKWWRYGVEAKFVEKE
jgi:hypothetical protein